MNKIHSVLLVDDEVLMLRMVGITLKANGYQVFSAASGADALTLYGEHAKEIAVVLTDVMMPEMDGIELARRLLAINPEVKIIASTGQSNESVPEQLSELGIMKCLKKPYRQAELLAAVRDAVHAG